MATTLVVTNDFPPRVGGIESFLTDVCALLDHDVVVYTSGPPGAAITDHERDYPVVREGTVLLPTARVRDRAVSLFGEHGCSRVVFGAAAPLGLLAPSLRRAGAVAMLGLTHGHEIWWASVPGARRLLRRIGNGCDHLSTISDYSTRRIGPALSADGQRKLVRLAPPVDTATFCPPAAPAPQGRCVPSGRCIAVGRFVSQKGFSTLLHAWRLVLDRAGPGPGQPGEHQPGPGRPGPGQRELVLVGDGPQRPRLERLISSLNLDHTVRLTGALPREDVVCELQQAQVFALPVRTRLAGLNPEGLGLAALEAASCGLPVVIGRSGGAPETVRHGCTGFVVSPDDPAELARRIGQLLDDPRLAQEMGARGRNLVVDRFGLDQARRTLRSALALA